MFLPPALPIFFSPVNPSRLVYHFQNSSHFSCFSVTMPKRKESKYGAREKGKSSKPKKRERLFSSEEEIHYTPTKSRSIKDIWTS